MNTWSVMLTVLVLNLHHRDIRTPVPGWIRFIVFRGIARLLCMYRNPDGLPRPARSRRGDGGYSMGSLVGRWIACCRTVGFFSTDASSARSSTGVLTPTTNGLACRGVGLRVPRAVASSTDSLPASAYADADHWTRAGDHVTAGAENVDAEAAGEETSQNEWKQLARVVDRLLFWLTLIALVSVSVVMLGLLQQRSDGNDAVTAS